MLEGEQLRSNVLILKAFFGPVPSTAVPFRGLMLPPGTLSGIMWLSKAS